MRVFLETQPKKAPNALGLRCSRALMGSSNLFVEIKISGCGTGNQARAATESQILDGPADKNQNATPEFDDVHQMHERPDQPGRQPGNMKAKDVRHRRSPADYSYIPFVKILE